MTSLPFDSSAIEERLREFWKLDTSFGVESYAPDVYLLEMVSDRYTLTRGFQILHDALQLAHDSHVPSMAANAADLSLPSVLCTLAHSNCGDRINQGLSKSTYEHMVGSRFGTLSERGYLKLEAFYPTGGGTDGGYTLAHVTVSHALDAPIQARLFGGNARSYLLVGMDLKTHVGRLEKPEGIEFGMVQESHWREPRLACGAIVGTLRAFDDTNPVHARIRSDLGEDNFTFLRDQGVKTEEGIDITAVVAAAIVSVRGLKNTANALRNELGERGVGHLTASIAVNQPSVLDTLIYLKRATVFRGEVMMQGLSLDARKYGGRLERHGGQDRLTLFYDGATDPEDYVVRTLPR